MGPDIQLLLTATREIRGPFSITRPKRIFIICSPTKSMTVSKNKKLESKKLRRLTKNQDMSEDNAKIAQCMLYLNSSILLKSVPKKNTKIYVFLLYLACSCFYLQPHSTAAYKLFINKQRQHI